MKYSTMLSYFLVVVGDKLKSQVKKAELRASTAEDLLSKQSDILSDQSQIEIFYSCMKLIQTVCPPVSPTPEPNLERIQRSVPQRTGSYPCAETARELERLVPVRHQQAERTLGEKTRIKSWSYLQCAYISR